METFQIHHTTLDILLIDPPASLSVKGGSALAGQKNGKSAHQLELGYRVALAQANSKHLESIAFQGVDIQICGCPLEEAADTALAAVQEFLDTNPNTTLRRILFLQYSRDAYEAFCAGGKKLRSAGSEHEALSRGRSA